MFKKILIANRGEIAIRIIQTCKKMGIETVAVYSDIDERSRHVREADEAVHIGPSPSTSSYLDHGKIIDAAVQCGCEAIHPGYGFLSENSEFAAAVAKKGITFIGPGSDVIAALGDKISAKEIAMKAGVPVVPGHNEPVKDIKKIKKLCEDIGYPVLLKPAAGGGGRGMRIVSKPGELESSLKSAQDETRKAFGDDRIFIERFITNPRHIEIQIMADNHGNVIHLGERECSIQRRYQKVIEEAPSVAVDEDLRKRMGEMACALAREAGYSNAGTVEFILDETGEFFFMEMNTRLQVEHPVTEMITGLDLVELQIKIGAGETLPLAQQDVKLNGWAIEARINAEDPSRNFLPSTGLLTRYSGLRGNNIRLDSGVEAGSFVSVYYDSMLFKVISWGESREDARKNLIHALNRFDVEGVITNLDFANSILNHPQFIKGEMTTKFIDEHYENGFTKVPPSKEQLETMVAASTVVFHNRQKQFHESFKDVIAKVGTSHTPQDHFNYVVKCNDDVFEVELTGIHLGSDWKIKVNGTEYAVETPPFEFYRRRIRLLINGQKQYFRQQYRGHFIWTAFCGYTRVFEIYTPREWRLSQYMPKVEKGAQANVLLSPLPGLVVNILVDKGDRVYRGQDLVVIESMKMECGVASPCDGLVEEIPTAVGNTVDTDETLIKFKI
ncbi:MAG: acetyl/propionyl/methylcrotonyl-CoA carboxylase subunit alpha [Nitrospirota bacterium]|nr:MAG: acetyl/propionyl/methylcrotonyl-CoA carboxylase subunit alpha [Nitrospirota bacterium]